MAFSLNKVQLIGNLGRDPEIRFTQDGRPIANLNIATSETWNDQQGQRQEKTEWHRVVIFGKLAEIAQQYLKKGSKVYIEGALQTRKWTDNQGVERYTTEVTLPPFKSQMIILDSRSGQGSGQYPGAGGYAGASAPQGGGFAGGTPMSGEGAPPGGGFAPRTPAAAPRATAPVRDTSNPPPAQPFDQGPDFDDDIPF
ncbi:MAG: single-stranded DNA-binding protein [Magnetococcales bacterium]|nr:single-stranded DNA-binding protein [Magnetococcales bacterium]